MTVEPVEATADNFIYDNPFTDEEDDDIDSDFAFSYKWLQNSPQTTGQSTMNVFWWDLWFYTDYKDYRVCCRRELRQLYSDV